MNFFGKDRKRNTFCPLPWISASLRNNGQYRLCCPSNQSEGKGLLRDDFGRDLRGETDPLTKVRNAPLMREVRSTMLRGEWPTTCLRCQGEEAAGIASRRQIEGELWKKTISYAKAARLTKSDGSIDTEEIPLAHFDVRLGNRCNLKCRSCNPTESSMWYGDHEKIWGETYRESNYEVRIKKSDGGVWTVSPNFYNWHDNEFFWFELGSQLDDIQVIYFAGGEPLLIDRHIQFLEKCISSGRANKIVIEYNTNLTVIPRKAPALWRQFRAVHFGVSLDGVGAVNDYIRAPSRFETIAKNLHLIDKMPGNFVIWLCPTVMVYNLLNMPDLMIWAMREKFKRVGMNRKEPLINPHPLHRPAFLNIQSLSLAEKSRAESLLNARLDEIKNVAAEVYQWDRRMRKASQARAQQIIESYIRFMRQQDLTDQKSKFWYYTQALDQNRGETLSTAIPQLAQLLDPAPKEVQSAAPSPVKPSDEPGPLSP